MLTAITSWLVSEGAGLMLGALAKLALDAWNSWRADRTLVDLGRVTAERDQADRGLQATGRELEALRNAPQGADEAIARLEDGSA